MVLVKGRTCLHLKSQKAMCILCKPYLPFETQHIPKYQIIRCLQERKLHRSRGIQDALASLVGVEAAVATFLARGLKMTKGTTHATASWLTATMPTKLR